MNHAINLEKLTKQLDSARRANAIALDEVSRREFQEPEEIEDLYLRLDLLLKHTEQFLEQALLYLQGEEQADLFDQ